MTIRPRLAEWEREFLADLLVLTHDAQDSLREGDDTDIQDKLHAIESRIRAALVLL